MIALRSSTLRATLALVAGLTWSSAHASDPWPDPRPIAQGTPAFQAPAVPPRDATTGEPPAPEPTGPLSLRDALALALMRNPDLAAFSWEVRVGEARALQAGKLPNPELDVRLYRLRANSPDPADEESRRRVILSQAFELGGKRGRRVDLAESERDLAGWDYEAKRVEVATAVAVHFVAVLGAQRRVESWRGLVLFLDEMRDRAAKLVGTGSLRSVEIHQVNRQAGLARIQLRTAESELQAARLKLASMWDSRLPAFTEAVGDLEEVQPIPNIETIMDLARNGPAIARWDAERARGNAALALAKSERAPDVTYGLGVRWDEVAGTRDYLMDFRITLPVFDRKQGAILEERYGQARIEASRKAAEVVTRQEIADSYYPMVENDARRSTLANEVLPAARATFEAHRQGLEIQAANLDDLLDARRDLTNAEVDYTNALVGYHEALSRLEGVIGHSLGAQE